MIFQNAKNRRFNQDILVAKAAAGVAVQWSVRGMFVGAGALILAVTLIAVFQRPVRDID